MKCYFSDPEHASTDIQPEELRFLFTLDAWRFGHDRITKWYNVQDHGWPSFLDGVNFKALHEPQTLVAAIQLVSTSLLSIADPR